MKLKVKTINLFDRELQISERTAGDVIALSEMQTDKTAKNSIYQSVMVIEQGLKINLKELKWYQFIKKYKLKRILSRSYILNNLAASIIMEIAMEILILEGLVPDKSTNKKKVVKKEHK